MITLVEHYYLTYGLYFLLSALTVHVALGLVLDRIAILIPIPVPVLLLSHVSALLYPTSSRFVLFSSRLVLSIVYLVVVVISFSRFSCLGSFCWSAGLLCRSLV